MNEISLHILDIVQNSIAAGAEHISVEVYEDIGNDILAVTVIDDGSGMDPDTAERVQSPFTTSRKTRKVGLGIPLFKEGCLSTGGKFHLQSEPGRGTTISGSYGMSHIDRPPLGNVADTMFLLVAANPGLDFKFRHGRSAEVYEFSTVEVRQALGSDVPLDNPDVLQWIRQYLFESEHNLRGGAVEL